HARENPSAMFSATRSCRATIGRMPASARASRIGVYGKQNTCLTPSIFRISAIACAPFIVVRSEESSFVQRFRTLFSAALPATSVAYCSRLAPRGGLRAVIAQLTSEQLKALLAGARSCCCHARLRRGEVLRGWGVTRRGNAQTSSRGARRLHYACNIRLLGV